MLKKGDKVEYKGVITSCVNDEKDNEKKEINQCPECGNKNFNYDVMDLMGDGKEEHFGKTTIICSDKDCGLVIGYLD